MHNILVINPGSTSTKLAVFEDEKPILKTSIEHSNYEGNEDIEEIIKTRTDDIRKFLKANGYKRENLTAISCRGGILPPLPGGTYIVDDDMVDYLLHQSPVDHPSNYAAPIGMQLSQKKIPVFITDPISTDEFIDEARLSGIPQIKRLSLLHTLNMRAVSHKVAKAFGKNINEINMVVAHLGGGISVGLLLNGRFVDVNNANGEGPFSPTRAGELPVGDLAKMCFSKKFTKKGLINRYTKKGGLKAYLGTDSLKEALKNTDDFSRLVIDAMAYQIGKEIGGMCAVAGGKIDAIVLTGGMAYSSSFVEKVKTYIAKFGLVVTEPGEHEMLALAQGAIRALNKVETPKTFSLEELV
ncbi:MAG: butyrate kinase [Kosmotoga sp.]|nr:MAG: butyrate kinase [Kosmotoga sp.]